MSQNWNDLQFFLAIYESKSLVGASVKLKVDETTVGRRLQALERDLGAKLFERKKRGYLPTLSGLKVLEAALPIRKQLLGLKTQIEGSDQSLKGQVKITLPESIANLLVMPKLGDFLATYPDLKLELIMSTATVNISKREADIAIRMFKPSAHTLYAQNLGKLRFAFFGQDAKLNPLAGQNLIYYSETVSTDAEASVLKKLKKQFPSQIEVNSRGSLHAALNAGLGFGMIPEIMSDEIQNGSLMLRDGLAPIDLPVWMVVHSDLKTNARVRATADFLKGVIKPKLR